MTAGRRCPLGLFLEAFNHFACGSNKIRLAIYKVGAQKLRNRIYINIFFEPTMRLPCFTRIYLGQLINQPLNRITNL